MEYWVKNPIFVQANLTKPIIPEFHYSTIPNTIIPPFQIRTGPLKYE
jgi:hypothetical protein